MALVYDASAGQYYSPAVDGKGFTEATIYINTPSTATLDVDVSADGQTFSDHGTMAITGGATGVYRFTLDATNKFFRYSVTGSSTDNVTSSVALG